MQPYDDFPESQASHRPWWEMDVSDYLEELQASSADPFGVPPLYLMKYYVEFPDQDL